MEAAFAEARKLGINVAVSISDLEGHMKAFRRSDDAPFLTSEVATDKAWTSASYGMPTHNVECNSYKQSEG